MWDTTWMDAVDDGKGCYDQLLVGYSMRLLGMRLFCKQQAVAGAQGRQTEGTRARSRIP